MIYKLKAVGRYSGHHLQRSGAYCVDRTTGHSACIISVCPHPLNDIFETTMNYYLKLAGYLC